VNAHLSRALALFALLAAPVSAAAQVDDERPPGFEGDAEERDYFAEPEVPADPLRVLITGGGGFQLRIVEDLEFAQSRFGPAFIDVFGGVVLPGKGFRHGLGLVLGVNLSGDGDATTGVDAFGNPTVGVGYMPYIRFGDDWLLLPKVAFLFAAGQSVALGGEVTVGGSYLILAGFGIYAEAGISLWFGGPRSDADISFHPIVTGEVGVVFDYEVLP
jgi:hypothetical protein